MSKRTQKKTVPLTRAERLAQRSSKVTKRKSTKATKKATKRKKIAKTKNKPIINASQTAVSALGHLNTPVVRTEWTGKHWYTGDELDETFSVAPGEILTSDQDGSTFVFIRQEVDLNQLFFVKVQNDVSDSTKNNTCITKNQDHLRPNPYVFKSNVAPTPVTPTAPHAVPPPAPHPPTSTTMATTTSSTTDRLF